MNFNNYAGLMTLEHKIMSRWSIVHYTVMHLALLANSPVLPLLIDWDFLPSKRDPSTEFGAEGSWMPEPNLNASAEPSAKKDSSAESTENPNAEPSVEIDSSAESTEIDSA